MNKYEHGWDDTHEDATLKLYVCVQGSPDTLSKAAVYWEALFEDDILGTDKCSSMQHSWEHCCEVYGTPTATLIVNTVQVDPLWDDRTLGSWTLSPPFEPLPPTWYNHSGSPSLVLSLDVRRTNQIKTIDSNASADAMIARVTVIGCVFLAALCLVYKIYKCVKKHKCRWLRDTLISRHQTPIMMSSELGGAAELRSQGIAATSSTSATGTCNV
mmetsp:Transcript_45016/g.74706  ORF Transcript_45016/g.74706 Transcript_45016/m.74706 type:complete len:214 (-) Transcript_45016:87-728(-)|eukprot:CAMPEP_0119317442 /NCGR_PEP_ID=MMETSP1333-20130426/43154_1 /TAXON_ID=418940 /ORGANISM="Scyphosphaera apsteinii, Strain RCC1455" /LENGTH=213 /DNA_ID=CAMNT_0007323375 /DNA_START=140 /DNA_END=781 /DNA_ORIENTATION=+